MDKDREGISDAGRLLGRWAEARQNGNEGSFLRRNGEGLTDTLEERGRYEDADSIRGGGHPGWGLGGD